MNKDNWKKEFDATLSIESDGNDFYFKWVELDSKEGNLEDILDEWLGIGFTEKKVRVKVFEGAIFIQVIEEEEK